MSQGALPPPDTQPGEARNGRFGAGIRGRLQSLPIAGRIAAGFGVALALVLLLGVLGLVALLGINREIAGFSSAADTTNLAAELGIGMARLEVVMRDHLAEGDPDSMAEAQVLHDALTDTIERLVQRAKDPTDAAALANARTRLDAYWQGAERLIDLRVERNRLLDETIAGAANDVRSRLARYAQTGGVDSAALAGDLAIAITRVQDHLVRFVERRDAGDGASARNLLAAGRERLTEMNRYLWVSGTRELIGELGRLFAILSQGIDRLDELLVQDDAIRADVLLPNAARTAELAEGIRRRGEVGATALRRDLMDAAGVYVLVALWGAGVVFLLGLGGVWYVTRSVTRPLRGMTKAVAELAGGRTDVTLPAAAGGDEVADMAKAVQVLIREREETERMRRQAEALHDHLLAAKERAEEESTAKTEFLVNMGHRVHRPLADIARRAEALMGELHRLGHGDLAGEAEMVQWSAEQLTAQIESILDYSKIEAGIVRVEPEEVDPVRLITEVRERCLTIADINGNLVRSFAGPGTGRLRTDGDKLRQILVNLVDNACRYTRDGEVTLVVERDERNHLLFIVTDTGPGFPPEHTERLFQPFVRGAAESGWGAPGVGLGLTVVGHYCEMLGGQIEVASRPGKGTRITVDLPSVFPAHSMSPRHTPSPLLTVAEAPAD